MSLNWVLSEILDGILLVEQAAGLLLDRLDEIRVLASACNFDDEDDELVFVEYFANTLEQPINPWLLNDLKEQVGGVWISL